MLYLNHKASGHTKPYPGATIDWSHPLAPQTRTGFFLPCWGGGKAPVDLVQNLQWTGVNSGEDTGTHRQRAPDLFTGNKTSLRIAPTTPTRFKSTTAVPATSTITLACIFNSYQQFGNFGPVLIGVGTGSTGIYLSAFANAGTNYMVAIVPGHANVSLNSLPFNFGRWYFFGLCWNNTTKLLESYSLDYQTGQNYWRSQTLGFAWNTPDYFVVGGSTGNSNMYSDCDIYWAFCDNAYRGVPYLDKLARNPWAFLTHGQPGHYGIALAGGGGGGGGMVPPSLLMGSTLGAF